VSDEMVRLKKKAKQKRMKKKKGKKMINDVTFIES